MFSFPLSQSPITPSVSLSTAPSSAVHQFSNPFIPHSNILKHPRFVGAIDRTFHHFFHSVFVLLIYLCKSAHLCGLSQIQMRVRESSLNERYTGEYASQSRSTFLRFSWTSRAPFVFPYPLFPLPPFLSSQPPPFLVPIFSNLPVLFAWFIERWIGFFGFWLIYPRKSMHFCGEIIFSLLIYYSFLWIKESSLLRNFRMSIAVSLRSKENIIDSW